PTAVGPASTVRRAGGCPSAKPFHQFVDLLRTQPAYPAGLGDADLGHHLACSDLLHTCQRLQQRKHLALAVGLVLLTFGDHLGQLAARIFQTVLHLLPGRSGLRGLLERLGAFLRSQWWKSHGGSPSASGTESLAAI